MLKHGSGAAKDGDGAKNNELGDGFQFPKRRRVRGKATDDVKAFSAAEFTPLPKLFLSNVKNGVSIATIKEWLKNKTINFVGLYRKSKEHYVHQSFVITVTNETYNKVFDEALWPSGVTVREYAPPPHQTRWIIHLRSYLTTVKVLLCQRCLVSNTYYCNVMYCCLKRLGFLQTNSKSFLNNLIVMSQSVFQL